MDLYNGSIKLQVFGVLQVHVSKAITKTKVISNVLQVPQSSISYYAPIKYLQVLLTYTDENRIDHRRPIQKREKKGMDKNNKHRQPKG